MPSDNPLQQLWQSIWKGDASTILDRRPVQRSQPFLESEQIQIPELCWVLKGRISGPQANNWIPSLDPSTVISDILIREEYYEALKAAANHYQSGERDFVTDEKICGISLWPGPNGSLHFVNPLDTLIGHSDGEQRRFILIGHPGIGKPTRLLTCSIY